MWKALKERFKFFAEIVGNLIIDSLFLSVWVVIDYAVEYIIAKYRVGALPPYLKFPKYALDYATPVVIIGFVVADSLRSLCKIYDLIVDALKREKRDDAKEDDTSEEKKLNGKKRDDESGKNSL